MRVSTTSTTIRLIFSIFFEQMVEEEHSFLTNENRGRSTEETLRYILQLCLSLLPTNVDSGSTSNIPPLLCHYCGRTSNRLTIVIYSICISILRPPALWFEDERKYISLGNIIEFLISTVAQTLGAYHKK